ncbi:Cu-processing system ATP-binding protein [Tistlia consotensis]|uniref:Cu-processing system ATP-binding protein n=1 Tax=Tistlia consotensis USBA 355 TaxID=560819 RepID=A0A1Y6BU77_9PROT|nr:ABC transporter ATP-binding protein [Tistlia consotensis]SMF21604.1 Cu-processing system ATP-binding protein [Tistlia consotensis USBA 355]SNR46750.1 Cu-processing system ATP-binding protein [Tistlia consotensis]
MSAIVTLDHLTKRYGRLTALDDATLSLSAGETVALVGHNGAGKTTLMKLILGVIRPSAGRVRILGEDPAGRHGAQVRRRLGFLPESVAFHGAMTGSELLAFYARLKRAPLAANAGLLRRVGLAEAAGRRVGTYSKGMRQRLALAQALIGAPGILLLDEPTSGLDPDSRREVYQTIDRLRGEGVSILVSTHALAEVEPHVDRVALVHRGRLLAVGDMAELRRRVQLPLRVRLKVPFCTTGRVLERLSGYAEPLARSERHLELAVAAADRAALIHDLDRLRDLVEEVEIQSPGLDALYRHLTAGESR